MGRDLLLDRDGLPGLYRSCGHPCATRLSWCVIVEHIGRGRHFLGPSHYPRRNIYQKFGSCGFREDHALNVYSSPDLVNWTFRGNALPASQRPRGVNFRPKVVRNERTGQYILWVNLLPHGRRRDPCAYPTQRTSPQLRARALGRSVLSARRRRWHGVAPATSRSSSTQQIRIAQRMSHTMPGAKGSKKVEGRV
jgi:hypothetical protein